MTNPQPLSHDLCDDAREALQLAKELFEFGAYDRGMALARAARKAVIAARHEQEKEQAK